MKVSKGMYTNTMFRRIFSSRFNPDVLLGRWTRTDEKANSIKIFWANVDHCGTCSGEKVSIGKNVKPANHTPTNSTKSLQVVKEIR